MCVDSVRRVSLTVGVGVAVWRAGRPRGLARVVGGGVGRPPLPSCCQEYLHMYLPTRYLHLLHSVLESPLIKLSLHLIVLIIINKLFSNNRYYFLARFH